MASYGVAGRLATYPVDANWIVTSFEEFVMPRNMKFVIALSASVAACYGATAMMARHNWFNPLAIEQILSNPKGGGDTTTEFADLDRDGLPELIHGYEDLADPTVIIVTVAHGTDAGTWSDQQTEWTMPMGRTNSYLRYESIHVVDANNDDWPDLVLKCSDPYDGDNFTYFTLLNDQGNSFRCAGDIDGDGETRVYDLMDLLEDWGCTSEAQ